MDDTPDDDGDELYGDLLNTSRASEPPQKKAKKEPPVASASLPSAESQDLEKKVEELTAENHTLKRNIGTLYRTAKAEIKRKDEEIARLIREIEQLKK